MRTELETIAYIEKYILNVLSESETKVFEERMATDPSFKDEVNLQHELVQSLERIALQQSIQNAHQTYKLWKLLKLIGLIIIPVILAITTWYFIDTSNKVETKTVPAKTEKQLQLDTKTEQHTNSGSIPKKKTTTVSPSSSSILAANFMNDPLEQIPSELFTINTKKDTIIETRNGIVFLIPEYAFVDDNQNVVTENVALTIKEALDSHTIMTSGLSTTHNDKLLETGGMFFIEATKNGKKLQIHPEKEITADIPTQEYKKEMQLFDGEVGENGSINWINPKPLHKTLILQDILSLDFYPPNYLDTLAQKGYSITNKKFTDSLYYSFATVSKKEENYKTIGEYLDEELNIRQSRIQDIVRTDAVIVPSKDSVKLGTLNKAQLLGLDPLKVKAIWNERFQNTFIATKAFEERLQVIHQNCTEANAIFDLYAQNLNRDLSEIDQMVVSRFKKTSLREQFRFFAAQNLTNVATITSDVSQLNQYYLKQQKVYRLAVEKTQQKIDSILTIDKKYQTFSKQQLENYYLQELAITTEKVAQDLNVRLPRIFSQAQTNRSAIAIRNRETQIRNTQQTSALKIIQKEKRTRRYRAPIRTTGWKNIDRIVSEELLPSIKNRETTTIQNRGKSTTISYSNYEVSIENTKRFDQLLVYLVPSQFNSFIRLETKNERFTYRLNDFLSYRVYCIAYLNDVPYYIDKTIKNASDKLKLSKITTEALRKKLSKINSKNSSLELEVLYKVFKSKHGTNLKKYRELIKLKRALNSIVFPCKQTEILNDALVGEETELIISDSISFEENTTIAFEFVETVPIYPGCETFESAMERKKCMSEKIRRVINTKFDTSVMSGIQQLEGTQRIDAVFNIDTSGLVKDIRVRSNHPKLDAEAKRVIQLLPKMKPATQRGRTVIVKYTIPIMFSVH